MIAASNRISYKLAKIKHLLMSFQLVPISCSFSGQDVISGEKEKLETFPEEK